MSDFVILVDAGSDLKEELQKQYNIEMINGHIVQPDGKEIPSVLNWEKFTREEFYTALKKNPNGYATSPANAQEFEEVFEISTNTAHAAAITRSFCSKV